MKKNHIIITAVALAVVIILAVCITGLFSGGSGDTHTSASTQMPAEDGHAHTYGENGVCTVCHELSENIPSI